MTIANWGQLLGGLAIFMFAMSLLEESLRELAGRPFKKFLQNQTSNKIKAIAGGAIVTGVLQSSSVVLLMVLSFVGAGIMSMRNALAVTLGANLGSTLSGWIVATVGFKVSLDAISYPALAFSLLLKLLFPANNNIRNLSRFVIGFALLFLGLEWMKQSVSVIVENMDIGGYARLSPYLFIPAGIVFTAIVQSSSATMAITLTALYGRVIPFESAACIIIGSELGTTVKILIGARGGAPDKKRVALGNFTFNVLGALLATIFLYPLIHVVREWMMVKDELIALVTFQTSINILTIIVFYPFIGKFADYLDKLFMRGKKDAAAKYINNTDGALSAETLDAVRKETTRLIEHTIRLNRRALGLGDDGQPGTSGLRAVKRFFLQKGAPDDEYKKLKQLHGEILEFLVDAHRGHMAAEHAERTGKIITVSQYVMRAAKNIKDVRHNIDEISAAANDRLHEVYIHLQESQGAFYTGFQRLLVAATDADRPATKTMLNDIRATRSKDVQLVLDMLSNGYITEYDSSTLLNLSREIYSSNKGLLLAVEGMRELEM